MNLFRKRDNIPIPQPAQQPAQQPTQEDLNKLELKELAKTIEIENLYRLLDNRIDQLYLKLVEVQDQYWEMQKNILFLKDNFKQEGK